MRISEVLPTMKRRQRKVLHSDTQAGQFELPARQMHRSGKQSSEYHLLRTKIDECQQTSYSRSLMSCRAISSDRSLYFTASFVLKITQQAQAVNYRELNTPNVTKIDIGTNREERM
jgi:hypothetical protein